MYERRQPGRPRKAVALALLAAGVLVLALAETGHRPSYGARLQLPSSLRMDYPHMYAFAAPGSGVTLRASLDAAPAQFVSASFFVDGQAVTAVPAGTVLEGMWNSGAAANPTEHNVYAVAVVRDPQGNERSFDSRRPDPEGNGRAMLFAVAEIFLRRVEFTDSHPVGYSEDDTGVVGEEFTVPTTAAGGGAKRPHWELLSGPGASTEQGPYELCRAMAETAALRLHTNAGGSGGMPVRVAIQGSLPAWTAAWSAVVPISAGSQGTTTTPALADAIDTQLMALNLRWEVGFSDGVWVPLGNRDLAFTVWTDLGPREADPVAGRTLSFSRGDPKEAQRIPPSLKQFVLAPEETPAFERYVLHAEREKAAGGFRLSLGQSFRRSGTEAPGLAPKSGYLYDVSVFILPSKSAAVAEVKRWMEGGRSVPIAWKPGTATEKELAADEIWSCPERARSAGIYELILRSGSLVIYLDMRHGGEQLSEGVIALVEGTAARLLQRYSRSRAR